MSDRRLIATKYPVNGVHASPTSLPARIHKGAVRLCFHGGKAFGYAFNGTILSVKKHIAPSREDVCHSSYYKSAAWQSGDTQSIA